MRFDDRPDRSEAAEYYFTYIDKVGSGDIRRVLSSQRDSALDLLRGVSDEASRKRYAPDKWSVREMMSHVNDTERLFVFRAFWFARGLDGALPSFEQDIAVTHAGADARSWQSHLDEFRTVRAATLTFFDGLPGTAWMRRGTASGKEFTVRALAFITAGHVAHHLQVLQDRYLRT